MEAERKRFCDLCEAQHLTNKAAVWCSECEETLCPNCEVPHRIGRVTKKHGTLSIDDYNKLPTFVQKVKIHCNEHDERLEYFCSSHDTPCCVKCMKFTHRNCHESLTPLHEVIENAKTSKIAIDLAKTINDLQANLRKVLNFQEKNMQSLKLQADTCQNEIKEYRREINERLDKIEKDLLAELSMAYSEYSLKVGELITSLKSRIATIEELENDFSAIKQYATDLQTYLGLRDIAKVSHDQEAYLQLIRDTHKIVRTDIRFVRQTEILGKLDIKSEEEDIVLIKETEHEAQFFNPAQAGVIDVNTKYKKKKARPKYIPLNLE